MNIGIIITARVKSNRLHEKVLQKIKGRRTIEILIEHLQRQKEYPIVLAIPESQDDNALETIGEGMGVDIYRGEDNSPLHRLVGCAKKFKFDHVVRITADDILIDTFLLEKQIYFHTRGNNDYTYMKKCLDGTAGEVIRTRALEDIAKETEGQDIEFISYYLKRGGYRVKEFYPPYEYQYNYRLTMDYPEDLEVLRILFHNLAEPFGSLDIINYLRKHSYIMKINRMPCITFYTCNHNYGHYIVDCMKSVVNVDFDDWEYIVIDDCSTDNSSNAIMEYYTSLERDIQRKVKIQRLNENIGLPASCNKALTMARGKYIMRVDSDDMVHESIANTMLMHMNDKAGVISGYWELDGETKEIKENKWHPACCLLNRWCVNELKYKEGLEHYEGLEFFKRFNEVYHVTFIEDLLWYYRRHDEQKTNEKNNEVREKVKKEILK